MRAALAALFYMVEVMKLLFLLIVIFPQVVFGAAFDLYISQRNIANTATLTRTAPLPQLGVNSVMGLGEYDNLPVVWKLSSSMSIMNGELQCGPDWGSVVNKPVFSPVAVSGNYNDLINKPSSSGQVNSDWAAVSGPAEILNKPSLSVVATSGAYADLSGAPSIPAAQINSDWAAASGKGEILNKPSTLAGYGITDAYPLTGNPSNFLTSITSGQVTGALGFTPYSASNPSSFVSQSGARTAVSLTTTGTSGAATYNSSTGVLNVPNYTPPAVPARSQSAASRTLNTAFQVSTTRDALVNYSVQCTITASIAGGQSCDVVLEIATDAAFTAGVQTVGIIGTGQTYTLAVAIQGVQPQTAQVTGYVPAGYYARLRTVNVSGSPTYAYRAGQEVLQ